MLLGFELAMASEMGTRFSKMVKGMVSDLQMAMGIPSESQLIGYMSFS